MSTQASQRPDLPDRVCFGPLEIHVPRRELRVAGQLQPVAPRVFDLLVFLIQHRDRVVSKNELLTRVWNGAVVSEGVIARAVMKARQTLGDHGDQPIIIKTIHRVGYRFMGELDSPTQEAGSMAAAAPAPEPPQPRLRLALMALENRTGNPEHDWVGAGLHALVLQALETDPRLSLIALASLQAAQDALPAGLSTQDSTTALCGMLGMDALVHAVLVQQEGGFSIEFGVHGRPPRHDSGSAAVHGSDLTVLGQQLARGLETLLFPQQPMLVSFESADPLANHAYARAMQ